MNRRVLAVLREQARRICQSVLQENRLRLSGPPRITEVRFERIEETRSIRMIIHFEDDIVRSIDILHDLLEHCSTRELTHLSIRDFDGVYYQTLEDQRMEDSLGYARQTVAHAIERMANPREVDFLQQQYAQLRQHYLDHHRRHRIELNEFGPIGPRSNRDTFQWATQQVPDRSPPSVGDMVESVGDMVVCRYILTDDRIMNNLMDNLFDFHEVGDAKAQEKGLELLKSWLSPEQLKQYEKTKAFDVVGSSTGKRYRIKHGRQMNIEELTKDGKRKCGWCFLPSGNLVAGDVMLAQKVALETNELKALEVANRFP